MAYRRTVERDHNLVVKLSEDEDRKLAAIAEEGGETKSATVRRWIRVHYAEKFDDSPKGKPKRRTAKR